MGCTRGVAAVDRVAVDQLVTPDAGVGEGSRDRAADAAGVVFDDEFAQRRERRFCRLGIIPAAPDDHQCDYAGPTR